MTQLGTDLKTCFCHYIYYYYYLLLLFSMMAKMFFSDVYLAQWHQKATMAWQLESSVVL